MGRTARVSGVGPGSRATVRPAAGAVPATVGRSGLRGEEAAGRGGRQLLGVRRRRGAGAQVALDHGEGQIDHGEGDALAVLRRGGAEPPGQGGDGLAHPGVAARRPFGLRGGPLRVAELLRPAKQQRGPRGVPPTPGDHLAGRRRTRRHRVARRGEGVEPGRLEVLDGAQPERGEQRGPVREAVAGYVPGRWVRFAHRAARLRRVPRVHRPPARRGADGAAARPGDACARPGAAEPAAALPAAARRGDRGQPGPAERPCTGAAIRPARWSPLVRVLRRAVRAAGRGGAE